MPTLSGADCGCEVLDIGLDSFDVAKCDRSITSRGLPPGSPWIAKYALCQVREIHQVLIDECVARTAEPGKTILNIGGIARLRHLTVIYDVNASFFLLGYYSGHGVADMRRQLSAIDSLPFLFGVHDAH